MDLGVIQINIITLDRNSKQNTIFEYDDCCFRFNSTGIVLWL